MSHACMLFLSKSSMDTQLYAQLYVVISLLSCIVIVLKSLHQCGHIKNMYSIVSYHGFTDVYPCIVSWWCVI